MTIPKQEPDTNPDLDPDFDPYHFMFHANAVRAPLYVPGAIAAVMALLLIVVNLLQGTFGGADDFRFVDDARRVFSSSVRAPSPPAFPLIRDVVSWLLLLSIIAGMLLLHREWQLMKKCIPALVENGVLVACKPVRSDDGKLDIVRTYGINRLARLMRIDHIVGECNPEDALTTFLLAVKRSLRKKRTIIIVVILLASIILAELLIHGEQEGLFTAFAPSGLSGDRLHAWLAASYQSWWAGDDHFWGQLLYLIYAIIAFLIIVSFNVVGIIALYVIIGVKFVADPGADWFNRDQRYGWRPLAAVFRTVLDAVGLLGATLTVTMIAIGVRNFPWIGFVVSLYLLAVPLFVLTPALIFRRTERTAKDMRVAELIGMLDGVNVGHVDGLSQMATVLNEIERCHSARIRPLRMRSTGYATIISVWVVPILLTIIQLYFPWLHASP
jgi:hypothetical protein